MPTIQTCVLSMLWCDRRRTVAARVHHIFQSLGLRHLAVVEPRGYVVGIITRKDLDLASATGWAVLSAISVSVCVSLFNLSVCALDSVLQSICMCACLLAI